jgi:DNA-binding CsgD family transcriptional regulator
VAALRARRMRPLDPNAQISAHHTAVRMLRDSPAGAALPLFTVPGAAGTISDGVRYLATREMARQRLNEVSGGEIREFLTMSNEQAVDAESARAASPLDTSLHERGVQTRVLAPPPADGDPFDPSGHLVNGTSFRRRAGLDIPLKLIVVDRRISLFPADPGDLERGYLEVGHPAVVDALVGLFGRHWSGAAQSEYQGLPAIVLSARERSLVALLAAGHTDQSAAADLRISARSVTGIMRTLMDRLGVENRFQLGLTLGALRVAQPPSLAVPAGPAPVSDQES